MATVTEELSLAKVAARIAAEHDDIEEAIDALLAEVAISLEGMPEEVQLLIRRGAREILHDARHHWRTQVKAGERTDSKGQPLPCTRNEREVFEGINRLASRVLMEMQVGSKLLGDMTGEEVRVAASQADEHSKGWACRSRFFAAVADKTPAKGVVRKSWTERRLRKVQNGIK